MSGPHVITFYSYRGGVGRTSAIRNVAALLAASGRRVLMVDFDLASPGLTLACQPYTLGTYTYGVLELVRQFLDAGYRSWSEFTIQLRVPVLPGVDSPSGAIALLPAGPSQPGLYNELLSQMTQRARDFGNRSEELATNLRNEWTSRSEYDYVLIDSRTELTEESFLCAGGLADYLFVFTGLSQQHIEGTALALRSLLSRGSRFRKAVLVVGSTPIHQYTLVGERLARMGKSLSTQLADNLGEVSPTFLDSGSFLPLSYDATATLEDGVFVADHWNAPLSQDYRRLHERLREFCEDDALSLAGLQDQALLSKDYEKVLYALESRRGLDFLEGDTGRSHFVAYLRQLGSSLFFQPAHELGAARELLQYLCQHDPQCHYNYWSLARSDNEDETRPAPNRMHYWERAQTLAQQQGKLVDAQIIRMEQAQLEERWGTGVLPGSLPRQERGDLESILTYQIPPSANMGMALTYHNLAELARQDEDLDNEEFYLRQALDMHHRLGDTRREATALHSLGLLRRLMGDYKEGELLFRQALDLYESRSDQRASGIIRHSLGELLRLKGDYSAAMNLFDSALQSVRRLRISLGEVVVLLSTGALHYESNDYEGAIKTLRLVLQIETEEDSTFEKLLAKVYDNAARCQLNTDTKLDLLQAALGDCRGKVPNEWWLRVQLILADVQLSRDDTYLSEVVPLSDEVGRVARQVGFRAIEADAKAYSALAKSRRGDAGASGDAAVGRTYYEAQGVKNRPSVLLEKEFDLGTIDGLS